MKIIRPANLSRQLPRRHWAQSGFSLIEMLAVIVLIGIVAGIVVQVQQLATIAPADANGARGRGAESIL